MNYTLYYERIGRYQIKNFTPRDMKLESPGKGFSSRVMDKILAEDLALEKIKSERILGKGFWIILILFVALLAVILIVQNSASTSSGELNNLFNGLDKATSGYESIFAKMGNLPLSIAGILIASSILLFIERFINSNMKVFSK